MQVLTFNIQKFSVHDGPGLRTTVFVKGCPLRCQWCANPESISSKLELGVIKERCNACQKCLPVCAPEAIAFDDNGAIQINRARCNGCGQCVEACPAEALAVFGKTLSLDEAWHTVIQDKIFYEGSDRGGVTVSGGEGLRQAPFVFSLFQRSRQEGIGTCLDTSGYASPEVLKRVLPVTDYVLFDLKHMNSKKHRRLTGRGNELILANAAIAAASGATLLWRLPLVPGLNDSVENLEETARFVKSVSDSPTIEILPYHRLGLGKYKMLDRPYSLEHLQPPDPSHVDEAKKIFERARVRCLVSE